MINHQEALERILNTSKPLGIHQVLLQEALHSVLAEDIVYDIDMPPFDKSAMDGYACARNDIEKELQVVETIYAGKKPERNLKVGECAKIMTGAPLPVGADMVFMQEDAMDVDDGIIRCLNLSSKNNICYRGEDIKKGDIVVPRNTLLKPKHLPLLAGAGYYEVWVYEKPGVSVLVTGTELVEPNIKPLSHQIRNSNASQITGQLSALHIDYDYLGILQDDKDNLLSAIENALKQNDILIMSGGVSVGEFDLVPDILKQLELNVIVDKTAIQPGKPMVFACSNGKYVFGLSGNPVASFIQFEMYVKPFLFAQKGLKWKPITFQLPASKEYSRKNAKRCQFLPAQITNENNVEPIDFHGSAHIGALCFADCLIEVPIGVKIINKSEMVRIIMLD